VPTRTSTAWGDTTSNTGANYGEIDFDSGIKLTRIEVAWNISAAGDAATAPAYLNSNILVGIQIIPTGDTPLALPGDLNNASFVKVEHAVSGQRALAITPSSDTAWIVYLEGDRLIWAAQYPLFEASKVLFTTGQVNAGEYEIYCFGSMSVWWTDV
jgi:hypothetical protein